MNFQEAFDRREAGEPTEASEFSVEAASEVLLDTATGGEGSDASGVTVAAVTAAALPEPVATKGASPRISADEDRPSDSDDRKHRDERPR